MNPTTEQGAPDVISDAQELENIGREALESSIASGVEAAAGLVGTSSSRPPRFNAIKTGTRSLAVRAALAPAADAIAAGVTSDQGDAAGTVLARSIGAYGQVTTMRETLFDRMAGEAITNKGKARAMLGAYLSLLDRELRLAQLIGLTRSPRRVPTVSELLQQEHP